MKLPLNLILLSAFFLSQSLFAQQTGKVDYPTLGISFTIPSGWVGQETETGFLMGHNSIPGMILMIPHDQKYDLQALRTEARAGLNEGNGTNLQLAGQLENHGNNAIGGLYSGTLEWSPAKAYIIGMTNPYGNGVTILALTSQEAFNNNYRQYALSVKNSIRFKKPDIAKIVNEWKPYLSNSKLTFMESYSSYDAVGGGGGYSMKKEIDLCGRGYFNYYGSSSVSVDAGGAGDYSVSGYDHGNSQGNGSWEIAATADGKPILRLKFYSGEISEYVLTYQDNKLHLNGSRYFRTQDGEYAPNCR